MTCPICKKPTDPAARPFCSRRCADIDLYRWLSGRYALPGSPASDDADDPEEGGMNGDR
ncbi:DNA gyrase inhibitor YacG [Rhodosalinus sp. 5P4]|uniref:DNA gyrase inhibitor YacG n=1 Tax=Rhodosalinus sp. 5P4 TaxID=3239196 RepID=UPI0035236A35